MSAAAPASTAASPASSPAALLVFYLARTTGNLVKEKLRRLKEPRYLIGLVFGLGYFVLVFVRPNASRVRGRTGFPVTPESLGTLLPAAAAALAVFVLVSWLFRQGNPALPLSEGEIQFLFPAPLSRRAILHFALLRSQIGVFFSSFVVTLVFGRRGTGPPWQTAVGLWLVFTALHFHFMALGFTKARWKERTPGRRLAARALTAVVVLAFLAVLAVTVVEGIRRAADGFQGGGRGSLIQLETAFVTGPLGRLPFWLLLPFRWLLAPLFAPAPAFFVASLPAALAVALVQYVWVVRTNVSFEDATLENAARRAEIRARRTAGRLAEPPSGRKRARVPFRLAAAGRPEIAVLWKNLLCFRRASLARSGAFALAGIVLLFVASAAASFDDADAVGGGAVMLVAAFTVMLAVTLPMGLRVDLRGDLENADVLRLWPMAAVRLVLAELFAPILLSILLLAGGLGAGLAIAAGQVARARFFGGVLASKAAPWIQRPGDLLPVALAALLFLPALVAVVLVVQNAAVLTFPAWFPPGRKRAAGLEQTGMRLVSLLATVVLLAFALIPSGLLVAVLFFAAWKTLGLWTLPLASVLAALPLLAEAGAGVFLLAKLFEGFDPSEERTG